MRGVVAGEQDLVFQRLARAQRARQCTPPRLAVLDPEQLEKIEVLLRVHHVNIKIWLDHFITQPK